ncbi:ferritin-like domain-containing protein [Nocardia sp. NPDC059177]|uniref:ferritin-like domain-containing protein n=1 Tax=Nocardia sp. NPDC059177 TaxID=3346759 RepID=UPI00368479F1
MSTFDLYELPAEMSTWDVEARGHARFTWEYDDHRDSMLRLYQKGKDRQWDAVTRIDWSLEVDPEDPLQLPERALPFYGSKLWERLSLERRRELKGHYATWQFSQFLHGEQGAMICSARTIESVPDMDAKFFAATQAMDEARHAEIYAKFLQEKVGFLYPINPHIKSLLDNTLSDGRWDMPYLGMQVLIEGLALAMFGILRDNTRAELPKQLLAYIMQDEARHVAFGRLALRDYYAGLTRAELAEREEFVIEGCYALANRLRGREVFEHLGYSTDEGIAAVDNSQYVSDFHGLLFSRILPCLKDIGLWSTKLQEAYRNLGVLDRADADLDRMSQHDSDLADSLDRKRRDAFIKAEELDRLDDVNDAIALAEQD